MSGFAGSPTLPSAFPSENFLLRTLSGQQTASVVGQQQQNASNEIEMIARAASSMLNTQNYPDEASRAAAYPGVVRQLQSYGFARNAPTQYPGEATLRSLALMGTPSQTQFQYAQNLATNQAIAGGTPGASYQPSVTTPQPTGPGYAPTGASLTPYVAPNLPQGVTPAEDQAVRTVIGEAGSEPLIGQAAVAHVIKNRMDQSGQSATQVIYAPNQFEPWNNPTTRAGLERIDPTSQQYQTILNNVVRPAFSGQSQDPTGGATHFYSPGAQQKLGRDAPSWAANQTPTIIGGHNFYNIGYRSAPGTQPATTTVAATTGPVVLGDSLASPQGLGGTGVVGANPSAVLQQVQTAAKNGSLQGRDVVISTGASNDPSQVQSAEQQIKAAKDGGAKSVTIIGVGTRPDIVGSNGILQRIAQANGARFVPVDPATLSGDQVHPENYGPLKQAVGVAVAGPGGGQGDGRYVVASNAPVAPPGSTGAPAATSGVQPPAAQPNALGPGSSSAAPPAAAGPGPPAPQPGSTTSSPPAPLLGQLDSEGLTANNRQTLQTLARLPATTPASLVALKSQMAQQNIAVQQKQFSDWLQLQQLQTSQGQLTVAQQNSALEYWKAAHPDAKVTMTGGEIITQDPRTGQEIAPRIQVTPQRADTAAMAILSRLGPKVANGTATPEEQAQYAVAVDSYRQPQLRENPVTRETVRVNTRELPAGFPEPPALGGGAGAPGGAPGGGGNVVMPGYSPQQQEVARNPAAYKVAENQYDRDSKEVSGLAAATRQAQSDNIRIKEMQDILQSNYTGPGTESAANIRAWFQRWMPSALTSWEQESKNLTGPAAIEAFQKLALKGAGTQEQQTLGARGGARAIEIFQRNNPGSELLNPANKAMLDMQLIANQADADYAQGALSHFADQEKRFQTTNQYDSLAQFDRQWLSQRQPQVYAAAIGALAGQPPEQWAKGLSDAEYNRALDIISRAKPSAVVETKEGRKLMQPSAAATPPPAGFRIIQ